MARVRRAATTAFCGLLCLMALWFYELGHALGPRSEEYIPFLTTAQYTHADLVLPGLVPVTSDVTSAPEEVDAAAGVGREALQR